MGKGKVIVAPNAFKGSLSAPEAAAAITRGLTEVFPHRELIAIPLADGGDGTTECIIRATAGRLFRREVTGPLGGRVDGFWGLTGDGSTAVVEVAAASGLALLTRDQLNPCDATSYGTGELINAAIESGCRAIFVGLGGSATSDAG
ncbi:MAG: glycerate kinase, partial [Bacillota bacterium]